MTNVPELLAPAGDMKKLDVALEYGADAVYIATAALLALGCHLCRSCHTGNCNWGHCHPKAGAGKKA